MKPNLIDYKILEKDLNILQFNKNSFNLNLVLIATIIFILFLIFYIFRNKNSKKERTNYTLNKLFYIYNKSNDEIEKKQAIYNNLIQNSNVENTSQAIQQDNLNEHGVQNYYIQTLGESTRNANLIQQEQPYINNYVY